MKDDSYVDTLGGFPVEGRQNERRSIFSLCRVCDRQIYRRTSASKSANNPEACNLWCVLVRISISVGYQPFDEGSFILAQRSWVRLEKISHQIRRGQFGTAAGRTNAQQDGRRYEDRLAKPARSSTLRFPATAQAGTQP
jgi:hypothetical protein